MNAFVLFRKFLPHMSSSNCSDKKAVGRMNLLRSAIVYVCELHLRVDAWKERFVVSGYFVVVAWYIHERMDEIFHLMVSFIC